MAQLRNTLTVDSPLGMRRFDLFLGDICAASAELLAISTHANPEYQLEGRVLESLRERYGAELTELRPLLMVEGAAGTYRATFSAPLPYREVLVVRLPGARSIAEGGGDPLEAYGRFVWSLFGSVAALELEGSGHRRLAMSLLGGQRDYEVTSALRILLEQAIRWLERSRAMEQIGLHIVDHAIVEDWDAAMNTVLGRRPVTAARAEVSGALAREILDQARHLLGTDPGPRRAYEGIVAALERQPMYLQQVAASGRLLAEHLTCAMCERANIPWQGNLYLDIEHVRERGEVAPWITVYLHALRVFGNEELHARAGVRYEPKTLEDGDLVAMLGAMQRLMAYRIAHHERGSPAAK